MISFPETPRELLTRLAVRATGGSEAEWCRFFELYEPAIRSFAVATGAAEAGEDVAQEIFIRLVDVFRGGAYRPERGRFRSYLAAMIRHEVVNRWKSRAAKDRRREVPLEGVPEETATETAEAGAFVDAQWLLARRTAAVDHVLTKTALSRRSAAIYRAHVLEGRPAAEVAAAFGVSRNVVAQVKTRVERMVSNLLELTDEA